MAQAAADSSTQKATWRYWIMLALALVAGGSVLLVRLLSVTQGEGESPSSTQANDWLGSPALHAQRGMSICEFIFEPYKCNAEGVYRGSNHELPYRCAWSVDRGCFAVNFTQQVWVKVHGCNSGLTNQKYGVWDFLAAMQLAVPKLPDDMDVVVVAPVVWLAVHPPFARGLPGRENGDALPYSELFDVNRLQEFMRTSAHMGDRASGGNRVVRVVERAPPWMQGLQYWDGSDKKAPTLIGSRCSATAGQRMRSEVDSVLPKAMMDAARHGRMLEMSCMFSCYRAHEKELAIVDVTWPAPHLVAVTDKIVDLLEAKLGGAAATFGACHMRMERDMCFAGPGNKRFFPRMGMHKEWFQACRFTPHLVEECLIQQGLASPGDALYVASGNEVLTSTWFKTWRKSSSFKVFTKLDVACPVSMPEEEAFESTSCVTFAGLGREELASIESHLLRRARYFAGVSTSTMSEFVRFVVSHEGRPAMVYNNDECMARLPPLTPAGGKRDGSGGGGGSGSGGRG